MISLSHAFERGNIAIFIKGVYLVYWTISCVLVLAVAAVYLIVLLVRWACICACEEVRWHVVMARSGYDSTSLYSLPAVMAAAQVTLEQIDTATAEKTS